MDRDRGRIARARLRSPALAGAARRATPGDRDAAERDRAFRRPRRRRDADATIRRSRGRAVDTRAGRETIRTGTQAPPAKPRPAPTSAIRRRGTCRRSTKRSAARAAGNDPRALRPARLAGQLRRRSVDLPLAPRTADLDVPLQPGRIRADGQRVCASSCASSRSKPKRRSSRATSASITSRRRPRSIRSSSTASRSCSSCRARSASRCPTWSRFRACSTI